MLGDIAVDGGLQVDDRAEHAAPLRRMNNDPGPLDMLQRPAPIADDGGQSRAAPGACDHASFLRHGRRFPRLGAFVNRLFMSVH